MDGHLSDKIEEAIQKATANSAHTSHLTPGKDTRTQLFVGNLPYRVRWQDLKDLFRQAGNVLRADVSLGPDNRSRGYGTVLLATAEDAGRAIDRFNGFCWLSRVLDVRVDRMPDSNAESPLQVPAVPSPGPPAQPEDAHDLYPPSGNILFVGNLPFHIQWQDLKDLFRQAGSIVRADVALGPDGRSRGFGTVVFASDQDADQAVAMFNGYEFNGRQLKVHHDKFTPAANPLHPFPSSSSAISSGSSTFLRSSSPLPPSLRHGSFGLGDLGRSTRSPPLLGSHSGVSGGFLDRDREHEDAPIWSADAPLDHDSLTASSLAASMRLGLNLSDNQTTIPSMLNPNPLSRAASLSRATPKYSSNASASLARSISGVSSSPLGRPSTLPPSPRSAHSLSGSLLNSPISATKESFQLGDIRLPGGSSSSSGSSRRGSTTSQDPLQSNRGFTEAEFIGQRNIQPPPVSNNASEEVSSSPRRPQNTISPSEPPFNRQQRPSFATSKTTPVGGRTSHPHHPGPISLPPLPAHLSSPPPVMPGSASPASNIPSHVYPLQGPFTPPINGGPGTPYGMPPITPSMPPFTFIPPWTPVVQTPGGSGTQAMGATPMANPYVQSYFAPAGFPGGPGTPPPLSPGFPVYPPRPAPTQAASSSGLSVQRTDGEQQDGQGPNREAMDNQQHQQQQQGTPQGPLFTPGVAMSPMSPYHPFPPGARVNPAVGGPVHLPHPPPGPMSPGGYYFSPMYYPVHGSPIPPPAPHSGGSGEPTSGGEGGYFDFAPRPAPAMGYFPPMPDATPSSAGDGSGVGEDGDGDSKVAKAIMRTPDDMQKKCEPAVVDPAMAQMRGESEEDEVVSKSKQGNHTCPIASESDLDDEDDEEEDESVLSSSVGKSGRRRSETGGSSTATSWHNSDIDGDGQKEGTHRDLSGGGISGGGRANSMRAEGRRAGWLSKSDSMTTTLGDHAPSSLQRADSLH